MRFTANNLPTLRARLVQHSQDWRWSSTLAHLRDKDDGLAALTLIGDRFPGLADLLAGAPDAGLFERLRAGGSSKQAAWAEERDGRKCIELSALSL